jgi:hypothetical protein
VDQKYVLHYVLLGWRVLSCLRRMASEEIDTLGRQGAEVWGQARQGSRGEAMLSIANPDDTGARRHPGIGSALNYMC